MTDKIYNSRIEDCKFYKDYIILSDYRNDIIYVLKEDKSLYKITSRDDSIKVPHGICFIDDIFIVANRQKPNGFISIFKFPDIIHGQMEYELISLVRSNENMASGVVCYKDSDSLPNLLSILVISNNNCVVKYTFDKDTNNLKNQGILIQNELNLADGIAINSDASLIACSNHNTGQVLIYKNDTSLNSNTVPCGYLTGQLLPHGLTFSNDDKYIIVTDAGSPYLFIYYDESKQWNTNSKYYKIVKVVDKFIQDFNIEEGGAKGIDIRNDVIIISSEYEVFKFLSLIALLSCTSDEIAILRHLSSLAKIFKKGTTSIRYSRNWIY